MIEKVRESRLDSDSALTRIYVTIFTDANCKGKLVCENDDGHRASWNIGHGGDCSKLEWNGKFEAEAFPGRITFKHGGYAGAKWYKV